MTLSGNMELWKDLIPDENLKPFEEAPMIREDIPAPSAEPSAGESGPAARQADLVKAIKYS